MSCRVCDRKFIQKSFYSLEMDNVVYMSQWELDEDSNALESIKAEIETK